MIYCTSLLSLVVAATLTCPFFFPTAPVSPKQPTQDETQGGVGLLGKWRAAHHPDVAAGIESIDEYLPDGILRCTIRDHVTGEVRTQDGTYRFLGEHLSVTRPDSEIRTIYYKIEKLNPYELVLIIVPAPRNSAAPPETELGSDLYRMLLKNPQQTRFSRMNVATTP